MLKAKRILVVIAIVLCAMESLSLFVQIIRPREEVPKSQWLQLVRATRDEVVRKTLVWYIGGLLFLGVAAAVRATQPWLELSFGIAGVAGLLVGVAGGGFSGREFLWPRFVLSLLTLAILVFISLHLSRRGKKSRSFPKNRRGGDVTVW